MKKTTDKDVIRYTSEIQLRSCRVFGGRLLKGHMNDYGFEAVLDSSPDDEAIHGGHIVKLEVKYMGGDKNLEIPHPVALYNRKWIDRAEDDEGQEYVDSIIALLDMIPKAIRIID